MKKTVLGAICAFVAALGSAPTMAQQVAPFRIGILNDQSSAYSAVGGKGSQAAIELAIADFGGKVLGRPIELISADHQNKVDVATGIAREWLEAKGVEAIFDLQNSAVALAVVSMADKANKVAIVSGAGTSDITGKACTPVSFHWTYDSYALSRVQPRSLVSMGKKNWYLINSDYAAGAALERDVSETVSAAGGKIVGKARVPLGAANFGSTFLTAENAKADVIMLGGGGSDLVNQVKQAKELGLGEQQMLSTPYGGFIDVHTMGLGNAKGMLVSESFYWDLDDETRAWSKRYIEKMGVPATMFQAGNYSAAMHYFKAVAAAGKTDGREVAKIMKRTPVNDMMSKNVVVREDGRVMRDFHLFRVKSPAQLKYKFDYLERIATLPGAEVFRPLSESECPIVKRGKPA